MRKSFLKVFVCAFASIWATIAYAEKICVDGIYYNILSQTTAEVTHRGEEADDWMSFSADALYVGDVVVPETFSHNGQTYTVTALGKDAFAGSKQLTSLSLPKSVTTTGDNLFSLCNSLRSITIDAENPVFFSDGGILYKKNPTTLFYVPRAIEGNISLRDGITTIPQGIFQYCSRLQTITLPANVTTIENGAFDSCESLYEVFFNNNLKTIEASAFHKCKRLMLISIPESVTTIRQSAFLNCENLTYVILKDGLTTIEKYAFAYCPNIVGIQLPRTLTTIGENAFLECTSLATVKNNSPLKLELGSTDNGCVARYASEILTDEKDATVQEKIYALLTKNKGYRHGYNELSAKDKATYDYIVERISHFEANEGATIYHRLDLPNLSFESPNITENLRALIAILQRMYRDMPELYILNSVPRYDYDNGVYYLRIVRLETPELYLEELTEIDAICEGIIAGIDETMTTAEKLKVLHDRFIDWGDYGGMESANAGNIKGAFLEKRAVCEGFSRAYLLLCQKAGIPCLYVSGQLLTSSTSNTWGNHAWNFVEVDGEWFHVDITTDGGFPGVCGSEGFLRGQDYFDINYKMTFSYGSNENLGTYYTMPTLAPTTYHIHQETIDEEAVAATCTEDGSSPLSHCSVCNKILSDGTTIPALGHDYQFDGCEWSDDLLSAHIYIVCRHDANHKEILDAQITSRETGKSIIYLASATYEDKIFIEQKEIKTKVQPDAIEDIRNNVTISYTPNTRTISIDSDTRNAACEVFTINGQPIAKRLFSGSTDISLANQTGTFIVIVQEQGMIVEKAIITAK